MITHLTPQQLRQAADLQERIAELQRELAELLGAVLEPAPATSVATETQAPARRRKISAAGIARIRAAQKARWAKNRASAPAPAAKPASGRRKMTPAGRARLAALARERWAKVRAEGGSRL